MRQIYILLLFILFGLPSQAQVFPFRNLVSFTLSANEENNCMFFDKEGMLWVGTNSGVKSYDGYTVKTYKSDIYSPGILPNNIVRSITEDHDNNLWLGTRNGLVRMNRHTGSFKTFLLPSESQRIIYTLFTSKDGTVWIGTDGGLSYFNPKDESFYTYNNKNTWLVDSNGKKTKMGGYSVKAIVEDKNGDLLIGTWSSGLLRLHRGSHTFQRYPVLNDMNSAYSLFFDSKQRLWVGTWGYGVIRLDNPGDVRNPKIYKYPYNTNHFDIFYKITEDPVTHTLWACTREGVCYIYESQLDNGWQMHTMIGDNALNFNNDIASDGNGNIWLCTQNNGIVQVNTTPSPFELCHLDTNKAGFPINYVYSMFTSDGEHVWLGLNPYGIALYNRKTGITLYNKSIPGFGSLNNRTLTTSISSIMERSNGELWFAVNNYGIIVKPKDGNAREVDTHTAPYIHDNFVNTLFESRDKTIWIGSRNGMSVVEPDNKGYALTMREGKTDFTSCDIRHISQDRQGRIWVATDNEGIICISGNPRNIKSLRYKQYSLKQKNIDVNDANCCTEDSKGRLWATSNSGGLFIYNKVEDRFESKNRAYHLSGDRVMAMEEDSYGNLWLTTDKSLANIVWGKDGNQPQNITYYTQEDGLGDLLFSPNVSCRWGKELFFGSKTGFFAFVPTPNMGKRHHKNAKLVITDLFIDDEPYAKLDSTLREDISPETPSYTQRIEIPSSVKKFDIEFALLTYGNAKKNIYAYRLDGYDDDWQYCNGEQHRATFQNLSSGTYRLHVKATDSYGQWQELPYTITIKVLPPWYASRWAGMIYILMLIMGLFAALRWYKDRLKTRNSLQMGVILTNITHELLTPLTVISATIYKLKSIAPQYEEDYYVMDSNINRTTRLLREILEVRKSQAGQLKLLVSRGDIGLFVKNACEGIRPMAEHQKITITENYPKGDCSAWFDADKLDKILYNLLSNAIKYNNTGGQIAVSLSLNKEVASISIQDNGIGMSKKKLKHLYTRFFDGDYRQQNMPGTGIGLSLTHDLVKLHHGDILCESMEGKGTTFTVNLPYHKSDYHDTEIDTSGSNRKTNDLAIQQAKEEKEQTEHKLNPIHTSIFIRKNVSKILVVEDNEELLALMLQVLSKNYHVLTAKNGKQAMNIIMKEKLDLVVSDVMMPVMDGIELTKRIKEDKSFWQLPVILLTAKNKEEDKTEAYSIGADGYITKPFKFEELEVRINAILDNRKKVIEKVESEVALAAQSASVKGGIGEGSQEGDNQKKSHLSNPDQAFVMRATELVIKNISNSEYGRDEFANDMAMGSSTLYNKVKATTGQTIVAFITSIRMKEAKRILEGDPDILINDLAVRVGFNTPKYFSKCFKKEFGIFPKEFAEQMQSKG